MRAGHLVSLLAVLLFFVGTLVDQQLGHLGQVVVSDLNGDGFDDLALASGTHPAGSGVGQIFLFFGYSASR